MTEENLNEVEKLARRAWEDVELRQKFSFLAQFVKAYFPIAPNTVGGTVTFLSFLLTFLLDSMRVYCPIKILMCFRSPTSLVDSAVNRA